MDVTSLLFILVLLVPALLLIAQMQREIGGQHGESERSRVQRQRDAVIRRRFDERRSKVWSAIDYAYLHFREREQVDVSPVPLLTTKDDARALTASPDGLNEITTSVITAAFDEFLSPSKSTRQRATITHRRT